MSTLPTKSLTRIAVFTGLACAGCCALPFIGLWFGSSLIASLAIYAEQMALAALLVGFIIYLFLRRHRQHATSCEVPLNKNE